MALPRARRRYARPRGYEPAREPAIERTRRVVREYEERERPFDPEVPPSWHPGPKEFLVNARAIRLAVKGRPYEAVRAAERRGIPVVVLGSGEWETYLDTPIEYWERVAEWFHDVAGYAPPFPPGSLLYYSESQAPEGYRYPAERQFAPNPEYETDPRLPDAYDEATDSIVKLEVGDHVRLRYALEQRARDIPAGSTGVVVEVIPTDDNGSVRVRFEDGREVVATAVILEEGDLRFDVVAQSQGYEANARRRLPKDWREKAARARAYEADVNRLLNSANAILAARGLERATFFEWYPRGLDFTPEQAAEEIIRGRELVADVPAVIRRGPTGEFEFEPNIDHDANPFPLGSRLPGEPVHQGHLKPGDRVELVDGRRGMVARTFPHKGLVWVVTDDEPPWMMPVKWNDVVRSLHVVKNPSPVLEARRGDSVTIAASDRQSGEEIYLFGVVMEDRPRQRGARLVRVFSEELPDGELAYVPEGDIVAVGTG